MKNKYLFCLILLVGLLPSMTLTAQIERGKRMNIPKIIPNKKTEREQKSSIEKERKEKAKNDEESEFTFEETPTIRFSSDFEPDAKTLPVQQFEPVKDLIESISEDTSRLDEGLQDIEIVEIEEVAQFAGSDEQVTTAAYYAVWDTKHVNPYGIDAKDFDEVVPIKLYDPTKNKFWSAPMNTGKPTSEFAYRWGRWHQGMDLDCETGDPVYAAFDGVIRIAGPQGAYGNCIVVRHDNGLETTYGHLSRINFETNTIVRAGDEIGLGGSTGRSTGSHLHFEVMYEGNRFNPREIFNFPANTVIGENYILTSNVFDYLRGGSTKRPEFEIEEEKPITVSYKKWVKIRSGDTLSEIATRYRTSIYTLAKLNRISASSRLMAGRKIRVM
jgi:murein DD-endopeptidase MepM/ murein hydrolase activator NlpD